MFIPLCAKPSMVKLLRERGHLLEDAIRHCLTKGGGSNGKLIVFIADGDVMAKVSIEFFIHLVRPANTCIICVVTNFCGWSNPKHFMSF